MDFGSGPLLSFFQDDKIRSAAEPYVRVLVRVPEAYLLLRPFDTTRPGLVVIDADARRVESISLAGTPDASEVADRLVKALRTPPRERVLLRVPEKATERAADWLNVLERAETPKALPGGFIEVWGPKATVTPAHVATIAAGLGMDIEVVDPVPVAITALRDGGALTKALVGVAGVRHTATTTTGATAWISRWLLHPRHLTARGLRGNVAAVKFQFKNLPDGGSVVKHLMRPFEEKGVLSVVPRVSEGSIELVVRPTTHDADATLAALLAGGLEKKP